ncbi:MAG: bifunctional RNase H/acid phosphatase [Actinomycetota bacterium]|nr:bifunctional RNase H/acid phosphatase [Actinomycetota bacterium]
MSAGPRSVLVEADGGSRGNPGPAAYGAVLKDAQTGEVIAERGGPIGVASNNVAEYRGLIAGLELFAEHAPDARLEVRMDSKLVVEQMSGNWKIKHPDMKPLALQAKRLAPSGTVFTWIPRDRNRDADRLVNEALDGKRAATLVEERAQASVSKTSTSPRDWSEPGTPTTLILVRHGVTDHTTSRKFSGGLASSNPGLNDEGRAQVRATAEWLSPLADGIGALVSSPVRRTRESAEILAAILGHEVEIEDDLAEMEFGTWDGLTFTEVHEKYPDEIRAWLGSLDTAAGGGESFRAVERRVLAGRDRLLESYAGKTVVAVSHVTPIKTLVADALGAPLDALHRMELSPASVSVVSYYEATPEGRPAMASLRLFNARPTEVPFVSR